MDIPQQPWLERATRNLTDFFEGQKRFAFQFIKIEPTSFVGLKGLAQDEVNKCRTILNHQLDLQKQLAGLRLRFGQGFEDDYVYRLFPYTGVGFFASAFGCRTEFPEVGNPMTHPAIRSIDEVDRLRIDLSRADLVNLAIDKIKYFLDATGGQVPISFPDLQSPINVASIVLDYTELLYALKTEPAKVHTLLRMITDAMLEILDKIQTLLPACRPSSAFWLPKGIWLSDDLMAVLSPEDYAEFALPYVDKLAARYGGLCLHSCGNPLGVVPVLSRYSRLMMLNFWEVTLRDFQDAGGAFPCNTCVVEDPWHNLDRRQIRKDPAEVIRDAMADIRRLRDHLQTPVLFSGVCPHPDYAKEYYAILTELAEKG